MGLLDRFRHGLEWLGRQGTRAIAASLLVGLAIPPLAAALKPVFPVAILLLLAFSFLRVEPALLRQEFRRPERVAIAMGWIMIAIPVAIGLGAAALGAERIGPGILLALVLYAAAPPVLSATTIAAMLGLDAALSLAALIVCTALTPLIAPWLIALLTGSAAGLDPFALAWRLFAFLGGAFLIAVAFRFVLGARRISASGGVFDGLSVILLFIFGIALMDGVTARAIAEPWLIAGLILLAFAMAIGLYVLTALLFWRSGAERALALGFSAAHRNMAVMMAAAGGSVPELTWVYFATAQFPIYLVPLLVTPVVHRLLPPRLPGA
jgi:hypothetical protein